MTTLTQAGIDYDKAISSINDLMVRGMEAWKAAGRIVADLVDQDQDAIDRIIEKSPMLTKGILRSLERIGRSELLPELLLKSGAAYARLREMPYSVQRRYMNEPVPVLIHTANGPDTLNVSLDSLTPRQARQVFGSDGVRDLSAQRAWLADNCAAPTPEADTLPFEVHGKTVVFTRPCKMSRADIAALLQRVS